MKHVKHVKHCETAQKSSTIQLSGNRRYLLNSDLLGEKTLLTIRFGCFTCFNRNFPDTFMWKVLIETWLKPLSFKQVSSSRGQVQSVADPVLFFPGSGYPGDPWKFPSLTSAKISESKYVDICNFSPDLLKIQ